jgi:hypothetical protein
MDAQRRTYPDKIGLQVARVTREGISSQVIHRWPNDIACGHFIQTVDPS